MSFFFNRFADRDKAKKRSGYHSSTYHRFFEDYVETRVPKANGKGTKILRVYRGFYYQQDIADMHRVRNRVLLALLYMIAVAFFLLSSLHATSGSIAWLLNISLFLSFIGLFWMLYILIYYMITPRKMTVGCYRATSKPLVRSGRLTAAALGVSALLQLLDSFLQTEKSLVAGLLCSAGFIVSGTAVFILAMLEYRIPYKKIRSENGMVDGGVEIRR